MYYMENHKHFVKVSLKPKIGGKVGVGASVNAWSQMEAIATDVLIPNS